MIIVAMDTRLPLPTLLSHALVAFTIEFDNEAEHRMPHRTTRYGSKAGFRQAPWLVSMVMWFNCMRFAGDDGLTARELVRRARTKTNFPGMHRWGYISMAPDLGDLRPKPPHSDWLVRATPAGREAQEVWRPLFDVIEQRWQERFDEDSIRRLKDSLRAIVSRLGFELPDCLPILGYGLFSRQRGGRQRPASKDDDGTHLPLVALLSRALLAFAIEFERESDLSLAMSANVVRVLDKEGVRVRDLPLLTGVSKEAVAMSLTFLTKQGYAFVEPDASGSRAKVVQMTAKGRKAQKGYRHLVEAVEKRWQSRFGNDSVETLRESLERLVGDATAQRSPLFRGLEPYLDGWRASVRRPETLPHFPTVLHRGGFPDGS